MTRLRGVLLGLLLAAALATTGCQRQGDQRQEIDIAGCAIAHVVRDPSGTVLDITADGCARSIDPVDRLGRMAWLRLPDDAAFARVRTDGADSASTLLSRAELEDRYGPVPRRENGNGPLPLLLPVALVGFAILLGTAVYKSVRRGVIVVMYRA